MTSGIDPSRIERMLACERIRFEQRHPRSHELAARGAGSLMFGVPLHWMSDWGTPFALHVAHARGAHVTDVDGIDHVDFCLGDTGAMFGHAPPPVARALRRCAGSGLTTMLPGEDAGVAAALLADRFGLPRWQFALTATDANRFVLRWARAATGRPVVLVFNGCYHGTVEDTLVDLRDGRAATRPSLLGQPRLVSDTTRVVEFNDLPGLAAALVPGDVACLLAEPAMTNVGMVLPEPGFWEQAAALAKAHGTLLVLDETHTLSAGPGGYAGEHGLAPDALVVGKALGGGVPCAAYGFTEALAARAEQAKRAAPPGHSGIGTTLAANLLSMAAVRATAEELLRPEVYASMIGTAALLEQGLRALFDRHGLPWCTSRLGARTEFQFSARPPRNGSQAQAAMEPALEHALHLRLVNEGVLVTPFHNMMLACPDTSADDVARLLAALDEALAELRSR